MLWLGKPCGYASGVTPGPWTFVLLALGAFRLYRLLARDTITASLREALTYPDDSAVTLASPVTPFVPLGSSATMPKTARLYASTLLRCHWCLGAWISFAVWGAWLVWPHAVRLACVPLALSAVVALLSKNLDD